MLKFILYFFLWANLISSAANLGFFFIEHEPLNGLMAVVNAVVVLFLWFVIQENEDNNPYRRY